MLNIVLLEPEIAQNTGNVMRTCACANCQLHLVEPMGFILTDRNLKRAGCDYWDSAIITRWACAEEFFQANEGKRMHFFTGRAERSYADRIYEEGDFLVFGRESRGIDEEILKRHEEDCTRIPMVDGMRSLNLSNAVAIAAYEANRQLGFPGLS